MFFFSLFLAGSRGDVDGTLDWVLRLGIFSLRLVLVLGARLPCSKSGAMGAAGEGRVSQGGLREPSFDGTVRISILLRGYRRYIIAALDYS